MLLDIIKQHNWIDIFVAILVLRICYVACGSGLPVEIFKTLGTFFALYLSLHYYVIFSDSFQGYLPIEVPEKILYFVCFLLLALVSFQVFVFLRMFLHPFMKMDAVPDVKRWGGFFLGLIRAFLFSSWLLFAFKICPFPYLNSSVPSSFSGARLVNLAPNTYTWIWENITSKFMANEKLNSEVFKY